MSEGRVLGRGRPQHALCCPCGRTDIIALGLCGTCYTLKRQDEAYFGGLREQVLERDGRRCRICGRPAKGKRSIAVHHRKPGVSTMESMITLCLAHHAMVTRTQMLCKEWPKLLRTLWREQHPDAHEQTPLDFATKKTPVISVSLFPEVES